jgi:hypothetical protein
MTLNSLNQLPCMVCITKHVYFSFVHQVLLELRPTTLPTYINYPKVKGCYVKTLIIQFFCPYFYYQVVTMYSVVSRSSQWVPGPR